MGEALSPEQQTLLDHRRADFPQFLAERYPCLEEFLADLGLPTPTLVRSAAHTFVKPLHAWLQSQTVSEADRTWLCARLGPFIGEVFAQRYQGQWLVCTDPSRRFFGRYVVGFGQAPENGYLVDAFEAAYSLAVQPAPRSLEAHIAEIETVLTAFHSPPSGAV
jgi:hypothetical protein